MKKRLTILLAIIVFFGAGFVLKGLYSNMNHSCVTSGLVTKKNIKPFRITFQMFEGSMNETKETEIIVKDENVWNLIEKQRYYFVMYYWKNNDKPVLGQIKINDEFGKIYGDKFRNN